MMPAHSIPHLIETLPQIRGRMQSDAPLAQATWFRVGGPAEILVRPADSADLAAFLAALPLEVPLTVIGAASNLIIRDGGIAGVVIRLARGGAACGVSARHRAPVPTLTTLPCPRPCPGLP